MNHIQFSMNSSNDKMKIFPLYIGTSGCDYHRVRLPFMFGEKYLCADTYHDFTPERMMKFIEKSDMIVWNRWCAIPLELVLQIKRKTGLKIIVDMDDWIELPFKHPNYQFYKDRGAALVIANLKHADAVTCTTARLAKKLKRYNDNVHVIPNALPYGHGQFKVNENTLEKNEKFTFIYTGQSSHLEDVRLLEKPFSQMSNEQEFGVALAGYSDSYVWHQMENVFKMVPNYTRIHSKPLDDYMSCYDRAHCSIVPLVSNHFNAHKSNLKLLEAASKKMPVIVSKVPPYSDDADAPVLWVEKPSDWIKFMKFFAREKYAAQDYGELLREWANEKFNLFKWNEYRFQLYKSLM